MRTLSRASLLIAFFIVPVVVGVTHQSHCPWDGGSDRSIDKFLEGATGAISMLVTFIAGLTVLAVTPLRRRAAFLGLVLMAFGIGLFVGRSFLTTLFCQPILG